ncbi:hypothetical protein [Arthrobacter sp. B1805]|uniref:hypothetical protein n=1 Tax=Arthrobacter sp. B1805 TaxID=2058892 RepID=UPI0011B05812|nr:hypothetical protein [Arthrobacter sp. B1805]
MSLFRHGRRILVVLALVPGLALGGAGLAAALPDPQNLVSSTTSLASPASVSDPADFLNTHTVPSSTTTSHYLEHRTQGLHTEIDLRPLGQEGRATRTTDETHQ